LEYRSSPRKADSAGAYEMDGINQLASIHSEKSTAVTLGAGLLSSAVSGEKRENSLGGE